MYTIGQVSAMYGIPISTLRYYDREGLLPGIQRTSGIRQFGQREIEALQVIECLKRSGLEIRDIRQFMDWCAEGSSTYAQRLQLFQRQRAAVAEEMERLRRVRDMLDYKCWYYTEALRDGSEERVSRAHSQEMPEEIRRAFERAHEKGPCH